MRRRPSEISHIAVGCAEETSTFTGQSQSTSECGRMTPEDSFIPEMCRSNVLQATDNLFQELRASQISCKNFVVFQKCLEDVVSHLPGPYTPQKFNSVDVDSECLSIFKEKYYKQVLEIILETANAECFSSQYFVDFLTRIFCVDGGGISMFFDSLNVLNRALMECVGHTKKLESIVYLLERLIKCEALETCMIELSKTNAQHLQINGKVSVDNFSIEIWHEIVQLLSSLPNRIANRLKKSTPLGFVPKKFCGIVVYHIANVVKFLGRCTHEYDIDICTDAISILLSKIAVNYNDLGTSTGLHHFFKCLGCWSVDKGISSITKGIFLTLSRQAVVWCAPMILTNIDNLILLREILGDVVIKSEDWAYVMCTKMPLLSQTVDPHMAINLGGYLHILDGGKLLFSLVSELMALWGNRSSILHTPLEQHISRTRMLLVSVAYLDFSVHDSAELERKLLSAVPAHLESSNDVVRVLGMFTAETVVEYIFKGKERPTLQFDYEGVDNSAIEVIESIRNCLKIVEENKKKFLLNETAGDSTPTEGSNWTINETCNKFGENELELMKEGEKLLKELGSECSLIEFAGEDSLPVPDSIKLGSGPALHTSSVNTDSAASNKTEAVEPLAEEDSELDSDDDLVQFDLSDDVKSDSKSPKYIRDLRDFLLETEDPETFQLCLEKGESLILSQMLDEDISLGIELLEILISLPEKYPVDNFELLKCNASVAVVVTYPVPSAEFLGKQFNIKERRYSVDQLLFILDVIVRSAKKLSNFKTDVESVISDAASNLIQSVGKTRRFFSTKFNPKVTVNKFASVAGSFFFPFIVGEKLKHLCSDLVDTVVLVQLLHSFATLMLCATSGQVAPRMATELVSLATVLHKHPQCGVRLETVRCVGAAVMSVHNICETNMMEILDLTYDWMTEMSSEDPDTRCRHLASQVASLISAERANSILQIFNDSSISQ